MVTYIVQLDERGVIVIFKWDIQGGYGGSKALENLCVRTTWITPIQVPSSRTAALNLVGGTEPHIFHACIHRILHS